LYWKGWMNNEDDWIASNGMRPRPLQGIAWRLAEGPGLGIKVVAVGKGWSRKTRCQETACKSRTPEGQSHTSAAGGESLLHRSMR
jgi:hypothetical protein